MLITYRTYSVIYKLTYIVQKSTRILYIYNLHFTIYYNTRRFTINDCDAINKKMNISIPNCIMVTSNVID